VFTHCCTLPVIYCPDCCSAVTLVDRVVRLLWLLCPYPPRTALPFITRYPLPVVDCRCSYPGPSIWCSVVTDCVGCRLQLLRLRCCGYLCSRLIAVRWLLLVVAVVGLRIYPCLGWNIAVVSLYPAFVPVAPARLPL